MAGLRGDTSTQGAELSSLSNCQSCVLNGPGVRREPHLDVASDFYILQQNGTSFLVRKDNIFN